MFNVLYIILYKLIFFFINISICFDYFKFFIFDEKLRVLVVIF